MCVCVQYCILTIKGGIDAMIYLELWGHGEKPCVFYIALKTLAVLDKHFLNAHLLTGIVESWLYCWVTAYHRLSMGTEFTHITMKSMERWDDKKQNEIFIAFYKCRFIPLGKASHSSFLPKQNETPQFPWIYDSHESWEKHSSILPQWILLHNTSENDFFPTSK